ncbi:unnamed protein product [Urochloa humidicola]
MARSEFEEYRSPNRILEVTIHKVYHPLSEAILHQIYGQFGMVENVYVCMGVEHMEAQVIFQSKLEAVEAYGELHGRHIYDDSCQMEIKWGLHNIPKCVSARATPGLLPVVARLHSTATGPFEIVGSAGPLLWGPSSESLEITCSNPWISTLIRISSQINIKSEKLCMIKGFYTFSSGRWAWRLFLVRNESQRHIRPVPVYQQRQD